ncbi:MAG: serine hydrolase [Planctomycetes bacterium]|nr:serine hydrolase [Planctomycetota bacterium]
MKLGLGSVGLVALLVVSAVGQSTYFPPKGTWRTGTPDQTSLDADKLAAAVAFAKTQGSNTARDLKTYIKSTLANEPHGEIVGPTRHRGDTNGIIIRNGYVVAEWGPTRRVDMTFSVSKTYLSTVVGLAVERRLIKSVDDLASSYVPTGHFEEPRNAKITWNHLLRQTSDWRGTLFDKPAWADRPPRGASLEVMQNQPKREPGEAWEYNDVRVNLLALCATHVWRRPLPQVLRQFVMDPIGASNTWRWHGYETSWITLDGLKVQCVSGGGHWGGGMFISTRDHARFGYLFLRNGRWVSRRIMSDRWIKAARTPTKARPTYGYMNWFLNPSTTRNGQPHRPMSAAPINSVTFRGAGSNVVYIDWDNDLLIVARWVRRNAMNGIVKRVLEAIVK